LSAVARPACQAGNALQKNRIKINELQVRCEVRTRSSTGCELMSIETIKEKVSSYATKYVCLTGGEPLLQKPSFELMRLLCDNGFQVSLETSGDISCVSVA
jgi:organic radical activating enzyme